MMDRQRAYQDEAVDTDTDMDMDMDVDVDVDMGITNYPMPTPLADIEFDSRFAASIAPMQISDDEMIRWGNGQYPQDSYIPVAVKHFLYLNNYHHVIPLHPFIVDATMTLPIGVRIVPPYEYPKWINKLAVGRYKGYYRQLHNGCRLVQLESFVSPEELGGMPTWNMFVPRTYHHLLLNFYALRSPYNTRWYDLDELVTGYSSDPQLAMYPANSTLDLPKIKTDDVNSDAKLALRNWLSHHLPFYFNLAVEMYHWLAYMHNDKLMLPDRLGEWKAATYLWSATYNLLRVNKEPSWVDKAALRHEVFETVFCDTYTEFADLLFDTFAKLDLPTSLFD